MNRSTNPLRALHALGQRVWLDNLSRTLLREGTLERLVREDGLAGVTSNPTIFYKAISGSAYYRDELAALRREGMLAPEARYERLAIPDIQAACDLLRPLHRATEGEDGYVSLEVSPALANDTAQTVAAARRLHALVARENVLIKVPATPAGIAAIEELIGVGISINVTLMFSLAHVHAVARAYLRGLERWIAGDGDARRIKSVASLFLSRVDTLVDQKLDTVSAPEELKGKTGVALAKLAYQEYRKIFKAQGPFTALAARGGRPQFMLWASTGTKNPAYSDLLYVEPLIGPETINTLPDATLNAFRDHGRAALTLESGIEDASRHFERLARLGIDLNEVGETLQVEGVKLFMQSFDELLGLLAAPASSAA
ncbi:MAG TPA: transaldolase [Burkholderiales bacterium]|nr:transaldolase [Burkholderiales bacterium]